LIREDELIALCKKQDRIAQKELFDRFSAKMLTVCIRYCGNEEDAKDVLQDGFFKVLTKIKSFRGQSKLETWLTRIFINEALNSFRQNRYKYRHQEFDGDIALPEEDVEIPDRDPQDVLKAVQELPDIYRVVINMYAVDGMTHTEIGKLLGITEGSSKSRLSRARKLLRDRLI
jgi:RNA polymerase sigma-70 factor (ECF subfamily)